MYPGRNTKFYSGMVDSRVRFHKEALRMRIIPKNFSIFAIR